ncbi:hypothetical protein CLV98_104122 [Dyadobacter jejuensis]|uniref:Glycosyl hydrolase family 43 n=1 Tax=Dyadobacter jejuensis TaxID=1082580 RepID=A0A316AMG7_9BACT|nr:glycoside hydrolase family protein [Dyadobacter jejuensis]PWJ58264.1 hypothetical protein CLV98_104122 [Dyadobacter jejuensis]
MLRTALVMVLLSILGHKAISQSSYSPPLFEGKITDIDDTNIFRTKDYYNWCGSIVKSEDGLYHMFYSRWPKATKFTGWLLYSEVAHAVSTTPSGPWEYKETVLKGRGAGHWDAITAHNPKIKFFEGKYYLYYISTNMGDRAYSEDELMEISHKGYTHPKWGILRPNQRTGVAVATSLEGPWERFDAPLIEPSGPIATLTVNPAIDRGRDGRYYLIIKGDKPNETKFIRNQAMAISDSPLGPFVIQPKPVIDYIDTEDMSLWYDQKRNKYFGIFHAHKFIGLVSSDDGIHWEKAQEYEVMPKKINRKDGTTMVPDRLERPFVYREDGDLQVLGLACKLGDDSFIITIPINE